jgi:hypothetical protein
MIQLYIPLLHLYPKETKSAYNKDTCTPMFIAAPFTIAKLWNQLRSSSTEWIKIDKMWYIHTLEYYLAIKNEITSFVGKQMKL